MYLKFLYLLVSTLPQFLQINPACLTPVAIVFFFLKFLPWGSLKLQVEENLFIFPSKCSLCVGCSHIFLESELQSLTFFSKMLLEATLVGS